MLNEASDASPRVDDFLRPTIEPDLDVRRFGSSANPDELPLLAFFTGIVPAGVLAAMNYHGLARPRAAWSCLAAALLAAPACTALTAWVASVQGPPIHDLWLFAGVRLLTVIAFLRIRRDQRLRFRAYVAAGRQPVSTDVLAGVVFFVSISALLVWFILVLELFGGPRSRV